MLPRICRALAWMSPSSAGAVAADVDADVDQPGLEAGDPQRRRHRRRAAGGLQDHRRAGAAGECGDPVLEVRGGRVGLLVGAERPGQGAPLRLRVGDDDRRAERPQRGHRAEADRAGPEDHRGVGAVDVAGPAGRVVGAAERLDQRGLGEAELVGDAVQPLRPDHEVLGRGPADREPEMVGADDALPHHPVAGGPAADVGADLGDLARPLVAGDDREPDRDDVLPGQQVEVGVADPDRPGADEDLVRPDTRGRRRRAAPVRRAARWWWPSSVHLSFLRDAAGAGPARRGRSDHRGDEFGLVGLVVGTGVDGGVDPAVLHDDDPVAQTRPARAGRRRAAARPPRRR